jgi:hypothetical protein
VGKHDDVTLSASETSKLAHGTSKVCIVISLVCFVVTVALWSSDIYRHPHTVTVLELGVWFAITAWLCLVPPYHGIVLTIGGVGALILWGYAHDLAPSYRAPWPFALGALVFSAGGLFLMVVAKISTEKHHRRSYWQEAWPGAVLVVAGGLAALVLNFALPDAPEWIPPLVVPAEGLR